MLMNRMITIASLIGGAASLLISFTFGNVFLSLIASLLFFLSLLTWKYGYILIPMFTKATNLIELRNNYEVPSSRDYILKKNESGYYAAKFLEVKFYESSIEKNDSQKTSMLEAFERAISSLKYIVKISLLISAIDLSKHIEDIKTKRSSAEAKKSKYTRDNSSDVMILDREIAMYNRLLDKITHGERPVELIAFASTTSFGLTREEAVARVNRQAKELKTILSSSLGADIADLSDKEMLRCFEWDLFFPASPEEMHDEVF